MKKRYYVIFAVVFVLLLAGFFFFRSTTIYAAQVVTLEKGSQIGIAPFTDRVDFGDVPQGETISKVITLENLGDNDNRIRVYFMGSIGGFIKTDPGTDFTLAAGQSEELKLTLTMPDSAPAGKKYIGRIIILRLP